MERVFEVLSGLSRRIFDAAFDLGKLFPLVADAIAEQCGDGCIVREIEGEWAIARAFAHRSESHRQWMEELVRAPLPATSPIVTELTRGVINFDQVPPDWIASLPASQRAFADRAPMRAILVVPIVGRSGVAGLILVFRHEPRSFDARDVRFVEELAGRTALAIEAGRHQKALARERQMLDAVLRQMPSAVAIVEAPSGRLILSNGGEQRIFGARPSATVPLEGPLAFKGFDVKGKQLEPEDWPLHRSIFRGEVVRGDDIEVQRQDGIRTWIRVSSAPVRDEGGTILAGVVTYDDITEEKRAEARMRYLDEASSLLSSSLDWEATLKSVASLMVPRVADWCAIEMIVSPPDEPLDTQQLAVAHFDPKRVELAWELRSRYPPDLSLTNGLPQVLRTGEPELLPEIPDELLVAGTKDEEHLRIARELGLRSAMVVPIIASGKVLGAISLVNAESGRIFNTADLSFARELAARAGLAIENARLYREANRAIAKRDEFLSVASHELRTPLTALELNVAALRRARERGADPSDVDERLKKIEAQSQRLTALVEELLDASRAATGRLELERVETDLAELVREVARRQQPAADRAGATVTVIADDDVVGSWDPSRLDRVVTNLLGNAIKYGRGTPVGLRVHRAGGEAVIEVEDHGVGIDAADQARIFDRFERAHSSRTYGGMGLGLWIVREIVEAHGGTVSVKSRLGEGACFTVRLPL